MGTKELATARTRFHSHAEKPSHANVFHRPLSRMDAPHAEIGQQKASTAHKQGRKTQKKLVP